MAGRPSLRGDRRREQGIFPHRLLPWALLFPQLLVVGVFFIWPTIRAFQDAFYRTNAFGFNSHFAGFENFIATIPTTGWLHSAEVTVIYAVLTTVLSMGIGLWLAATVEQVKKRRVVYRTLFLWTYAVPTAVAGALWLFIFEPGIGPGARALGALGVNWNAAIFGVQGIILVVAVSVWQQSAFSYLFFTAGLQAIPDTLLEAAALDGAGSARRFWSVVFPLLSPVTVYVLVLNISWVFFSSFSIIDIVTQGGPDNATNTLVYRLYLDAFQNFETNLAGAQTIVLLIIVIGITGLQFRFLNRRIHYR